MLANILYIDLKRKGKPGWSRIVLFWMGIPMTWLWLFLVREGSAVELEEIPDDADAILAEIRRDRRLNPMPPGRESLEPGQESEPEANGDEEG